MAKNGDAIRILSFITQTLKLSPALIHQLEKSTLDADT